MHDVKNVVSQLGLLARNAERHADKPEFRTDMVQTLKISAGRLSDLLVRLSHSPGMVLSRERLLEEVWGWADPTRAATRTVETHVKAVRHKLGADLVRTVHGVGYALEPPAPGEPSGGGVA